MDSTLDPKVKCTACWSWMETLTLRLADGDPTVLCEVLESTALEYGSGIFSEKCGSGIPSQREGQ